MKVKWMVMSFMERARKDPRLGPLHISLYMAIVYCSVQQGGRLEVVYASGELAGLAKVRRRTPFYRRLRQLHTYGYIVYEPSFDPAEGSRVKLIVF